MHYVIINAFFNYYIRRRLLMRFKILLFCCALGLTITLPTHAGSSSSNELNKLTKVVQPILKNEKSLDEPININTATVNEIITAKLYGIGKKRAEEIVEYRNQHGPFKSIDDLKNIGGINIKMIEKNSNKIVVK